MIVNRIENSSLSTLCERVGVAFEVGLDPHRVFDREADNNRAQYSRRMRAVSDEVRKGNSLADAIKSQGNYFPPHFAEMIEAGEKAGRLDRVLERLSEYYRQLADFRGVFLSSILWPLVQLGLAVIVIGLLIYLPSVMLPDAPPEKQDLIGIGLTGERGLLIYVAIIAVIATIAFAIYSLLRNGYFARLFEIGAYLPMIGRTINVFAEARFVQTLALAIEAGTTASSAIDLSFRSAGTGRFQRQADPARQAILHGRDMHSVLEDTGLFQPETLEIVELGEASGKLAEMLDKHFRFLKTQVKHSMATLTYIASALIWITIAALLITIIFRIFSMYIGSVEDAAIQTMTKGNQ